MGRVEEEAWNEEIALDTEVAHGVAPQAHLLYYFWGAKQPALNPTESEEEAFQNEFRDNEETALDEAADSSASVVSNSWGGNQESCNVEWSESQKKEFGEAEVSYAFAKAAALGKTFFFAAGDEPGYSGGPQGGCSYPASSPWVVAVGGTQGKTGSGDGKLASPEVTDGMADSNCSPLMDRPSWQTGIGTPLTQKEGALDFSRSQTEFLDKKLPEVSCKGGRAFPDVSADSCMSDPAFNCFGLTSVGALTEPLAGTSMSAPLVASGMAVDDGQDAEGGRPPLGFVAPLLYTLGQDPTTYARDFADITLGENAFLAKAGWDQATGWGTPNFAHLDSNETEVSYTGPEHAAKGHAASLSAHLTERGNSTALAGRMVRFEVAGTSCEGMTETSGNVQCSVTPATAGAGEAAVQFKGDGAFAPSSATAHFSVWTKSSRTEDRAAQRRRIRAAGDGWQRILHGGLRRHVSGNGRSTDDEVSARGHRQTDE